MKNDKKKTKSFKCPKLDVIVFEFEDIVTTSGNDDGTGGKDDMDD